MSKFAENNLRNGEQIVKKAKINPLAAIREFIICCIWIVIGVVCIKFLNFEQVKLGTYMAIVCFVIGALILLIKIIYLACMCLVVTNKRVIGKVGVIRRHSLDYPIEKVDNIQMKSSFWGAIFRYNTLIVMSSGGTTGVVFKAISNANEFKNTVTDAIEQHQAEARRAQAEEIAMAMRNANK